MDQNPKQQVAEKLRSSANVLITVSKNPSVDQLAAAIGLSLMLDALGKHTATVFSGQIPDILSFLEPEKTFDNSVDGLRDFIISLDKEKADKLRYKVEDDVVKVYITPYRSKITENDLSFTQGDFNVDVVLALGVKKKADLDEAITSHGRILHDATVVAINAGEIGGDVGSIDWTDPNANSLCEMLVSISEALEGGVLDGPMSTAFLTGIVAITERFSNDKTTPKLMTMAAQLMAAGANQQLISRELQLGGFAATSAEAQKPDEATLDLHEVKKQEKTEAAQPVEATPPATEELPADSDKLDDLEKKLQDAASNNQPKDDTQLAEGEQPTMDLPPVEVDTISKLDHRKGAYDGGEHESLSNNGAFNAMTLETTKTKHDAEKVEMNQDVKSHDIEPIQPDLPPAEVPVVPPAAVSVEPKLDLPPPPTPTPAAPPVVDIPSVEMPLPTPTPTQTVEPPENAPITAESEAVDMAASLEAARKAVEQAASQTPFNPSGNPIESLNATPMANDAPAQVDHAGEIPIIPQPPVTPPPMPPQMPPPLQMPTMPSVPQVPAPPVFDPNMNAGAQTFSIPPPQTGQTPPPPVDNGQFPPPPQ